MTNWRRRSFFDIAIVVVVNIVVVGNGSGGRIAGFDGIERQSGFLHHDRNGAEEVVDVVNVPLHLGVRA